MDQALAPVDLISGMPDPESVRALEALMLDQPQVDLGTQHIVHGGLSARTILIPAGTILTGAQTNCANVCVIFGDITVTTDEGPRRLTGFHVLPANAGAKRVGHAHADTWWTTLHRTDLTDVAEIEREMTDESALLQTNTLGHVRADYLRFLDEQGFTQEVVDAAMDRMRCLEVPMPDGFDGLETRPSPIHGVGMFASRCFASGDVMAPALLAGKRTPPARYTNHSPRPNAKFWKRPSGDIHLVALRDIDADEEVTIDYRQAVAEQGRAGREIMDEHISYQARTTGEQR